MEIVSPEKKEMYRRTGGHVRKGHERTWRKKLLSQHQSKSEAPEFDPLNMFPNKPTVSKMADATEPSRSKRSGI